MRAIAAILFSGVVLTECVSWVGFGIHPLVAESIGRNYVRFSGSGGTLSVFYYDRDPVIRLGQPIKGSQHLTGSPGGGFLRAVGVGFGRATFSEVVNAPAHPDSPVEVFVEGWGVMVPLWLVLPLTLLAGWIAARRRRHSAPAHG